MILTFNDPLLLDVLKICDRMPDDERAQLEAFTGQKFDVDSAAIGNFTVPGPKWVVKEGTEEEFHRGVAQPLMVGGFVQQRPGVWRDFLLSTPEAWDKKHFFQMTRICRKAMDTMLYSGHAHRLECIVPAARVQSRPELVRWYKLLGYNEEGPRYGYCANGADAIGFSRVRH